MHNAYQHAIMLLSRREQSSHELLDKLLRKGYARTEILSAIDRLKTENLQSDQRFIECMVRVRADQGKGPRYIIAELLEHQLPQEAIHAQVYSQLYDWGQLAAAARERKFGLDKPQDFKTQVKQQRFLMTRGFENQDIRLALQASNKVS